MPPFSLTNKLHFVIVDVRRLLQWRLLFRRKLKSVYAHKYDTQMTLIEKPGKSQSQSRINRIKRHFTDTYNRILLILEQSWKGAVSGAVAGTALFTTVASIYMEDVQTGISPLVDVLLITLLVCVCCALVYLVLRILGALNVLLPVALVVIVEITAAKTIQFIPFHFIAFGMMCGGMIAYARSIRHRKLLSALLFTAVVAISAYVFYFLSSDGFESAIVISESYRGQNVSSPAIEDPSKEGDYKVDELFYGSGSDQRRPEYAGNVTLRTPTVDATPFFNSTTGIRNQIRKIYWGFNSSHFPLNARVWFPRDAGPFPLVLIVHGNHIMSRYSDPGYEYLGRLLASRGYIVASVDENFLNMSWVMDYRDEMFMRGWLLLKHLECWRKWNEDPENPFYTKVDMKNIALLGHSRGGAAVAIATLINKLKRYHLDAKQKFDFDFSIKGIVQIAANDPYSLQDGNRLKPENVNYLALHGGYDHDIYTFVGNRVFNRVSFSDSQYHFKAALYIYRANHGQFNTRWGREDYGAPVSWFLNLKPIMDGEAQRRIAKVYISSFLDATLKGKKEGLAMMKDYRKAFALLPDDYYINRFDDTDTQTLVNYQEDFDVTTTSMRECSIEASNLKLWCENVIRLRDPAGSPLQPGVFLGWDNKDTTLNGIPRYSIHIAGAARKVLANRSSGNLVFTVCNNRNDLETVDFTIELCTKTAIVKKTFRSVFMLPPPLKTELTKWNFLLALERNRPVGRIPQYVEIPFSEFRKDNSAFMPSELEEIRFTFDRTESGEIFIGKIGLN